MGRLIEFAGNNALLVAGTIAMALAVLFYEIRQKSQGLTAVSPPQLVGLMNKGARVVDIREASLFETAHIVEAVNIPEADLSQGKARKIKQAKTVVLVCDNGIKSGQAVAAWRSAGYESAFSLKGGISAWQQDNMPLVAKK
jgi:rhodanese-related sulfurtransferase